MASFEFIFCDTYENTYGDNNLEYVRNKCKESKDLKKNILIFFDSNKKVCYIASGYIVFTIYKVSGVSQILFTELIFNHDDLSNYSINTKDIFSFFHLIARRNQDVLDWLLFNIDLWNAVSK